MYSNLQIYFSDSVTDFSFVSIEVGIPFATSDNALTIYNCTAALKYELSCKNLVVIGNNYN